MDSTSQESQYRAPRPSRLPLPLAGAHSTAARTGGDSQVKSGSHLPRLSGTGSLRLKPSSPLSESLGPHVRTRYGWNNLRPQEELAVEAADEDQSATLEATPPSANTLRYVEGDENSVSIRPNAEKQKRKPRPSLSERTLETLSQIPPSPSPSRRRPSITAGSTGMRPPSRPASSLRTSRSSASLRARSISPSKQARQASDRPCSPLEDVPPVPAIYDSSLVHTPTFKLNAATGKSVQQFRSTGKVAKNGEQVEDRTPLSSSFASKAKTVHELRGGATKSLKTRPSLASIFKEPPNQTPLSAQKSKVVPTKFEPSKRIVSTSRPARPLDKAPSKTVRACSRHEEDSPSGGDVRTPSKSAMTLRETIARAKAAKKKEASNNPMKSDTGMAITSTATDDGRFFGESAAVDGDRTLKHRMKAAITTGFLNLAAMELKSLPRELLTMYDYDANTQFNWAEAVDLTKMIAADNGLQEISDDFFPDWSIEEMQNDDDKSNQFGGLQILNLRGNFLTSLPIGLRRLGQLHTLDLSNNKLQAEALEIITQITSLKELNLSNNNLKGALPPSFNQLQNLQILDVHSNRISMVSEAALSLSKLQKLDLSDNCLESAPLTAIQKLPLVELNLSKNSLSGRLFPDGFTILTLRDLNVGFNRLRSLSGGELEFPSLQSLTCDKNEMGELPNLRSLQSLTSLAACENKITQLPDGFVELPLLRHVNLSANQIRVLDPLIANMENLTAMNVVANPLRDRKYLTMDTANLKIDLAKRLVSSTGAEDPASGHSHLASTALEQAESIYKYKPQRGILNLSSQNLKFIDMSIIDLSQPVHAVRLSNNELTALPAEFLNHDSIKHSLKALDVSHNQTLHPTAYLTADVRLPVLESLNIVSTGLTSLQALVRHLAAPSLRELNISCHRMTGPVPAAKAVFPSLTTLLATDNWFTSIEVEDIRGLEVLDIRNNDIEQVPPKLGELGNLDSNKTIAGRLRAFECSGNRFRVPRPAILEKGTEAVLRDLRRMVPSDQVGDEWRD